MSKNSQLLRRQALKFLGVPEFRLNADYKVRAAEQPSAESITTATNTSTISSHKSQAVGEQPVQAEPLQADNGLLDKTALLRQFALCEHCAKPPQWIPAMPDVEHSIQLLALVELENGARTDLLNSPEVELVKTIALALGFK